MANERYSIRLLGIKSPDGTIPLVALKEISEIILNGSERALRLSVEGASTKRGRIPEWLKRSLEFTVTGIRKGSTILEIEAPKLLESAPTQVQQQDLWYTRPNPEDTAISIFSKSVIEATSGNMESKYYDQGVLDSLLASKPLFDAYVDEVEITSQEKPQVSFNLKRDDLINISKLQKSMREPQAVIISGIFNLIEHAERRFQLVQEDGHKIFGRAESRLISDDDMKEFWGKKVTIRGMAYYSPSGKIRLIDGQVIKSFEPGEQVFERISDLDIPMVITQRVEMVEASRRPLMDIWGKWPGEESIDDILSALKEISREN